MAGQGHSVVAVIGDGALTGGLAFEGLNQAGHLNKDLIVILNENKMSISRNVGALSQYLTRLISAPVYRRFEADVYELLGKIPTVGGRAQSIGGRIKESLKNLVVPGILFEELGFRYYGPVDGHDVEQLIHVLNHIKGFRGPQIVHVITKKGKGYPHAERDASKFHGIGSFDKKTGILEKTSDFPSFTQVFGKTVTELAAARKDLVAVTAAMPDGTGLTAFKKRFPERFYDVGIAEQHAVTFSAGLARGGLKPVVAIYSTFLQRAYDQIIHDVALQNLNVCFAIDRGGLVGEDGPTHHGILDLSYLRGVPNLVVMAPKDENELRHMLATMVDYDGGPIAVRYPRDYGYGVELDSELSPIEIGRAEVLRQGGEVALIGIGSMVYPCLKAADTLREEGVDCCVINARFAKPLDEDILVKSASDVRLIVTVEENSVCGGFGSAVAELLSEKEVCTPVKMIGLPDHFVCHGSRTELISEAGLSEESIAASVKAALSKSA
jgi:1-deoxy-D-xylulose-5-phosphate synthase